MKITAPDLISKGPTEGILYLCTGRRGHLLRNSLASLKATNPNIPIFLLADRPYDIAFQWVNSWTRLASRRIKTKIGQYTPFELTLFVDDDTYFAKPIDLNKMLGEADMALALEYCMNMKQAISSKWWTQKAFHKEAEETFSVCGGDHPFYNTGVMLWRDNSRTRQFFQCWHNEWLKYKKCDQFAFIRALKRTNLAIKALPRSYNTFVCRTKSQLDEAHIYHLIGKEKGAINNGLWKPLAPGPFEASFSTALKNGPMTENQYQSIAREIYDHRPCSLLVVGDGCDGDLWSRCSAGEFLYVVEAGKSNSTATENRLEFNFQGPVNEWANRISTPKQINHSWDYIIVQGPRGFDNSCAERQIPIAWASKLARKAIFILDYDRPWERKICDYYLGPADRVIDADARIDQKLAVFYGKKSNSCTVPINNPKTMEITNEAQMPISRPKLTLKKSIRKNLVVVRTGDSSLHHRWLEGTNLRNFDIFVSYYGESTGKFKNDAEYYEYSTGLKWPILSKLVSENKDFFLSYDACWFPDDDLLTSGSNISRMFDIFHEHHLWLAQPSLDAGSYVNWAITARVTDTKLRMSDFVEIMCPIFSRQTLDALAYTFSLSASGWGLDSLWPKLLGYPNDRIALIDETPIIHTRPMKTGSFYDQCRKMNVSPNKDQKYIFKQYDLKLRRRIVYSKLAL